MTPAKLIDFLDLKWRLLWINNIPAADHHVFGGTDVTNAITGITSVLPMNTGEIVSDYPSLPSPPGPCIPCELAYRVPVINRLNYDPIVDANDQKVWGRLSKTVYVSGMSISGFDFQWASENCPNGGNLVLRFDPTGAGGNPGIALSVDAGATFPAGFKDVSALIDGDLEYFIGGIPGVAISTVTLKRNAAALPGVITDAIIQLDKTNWSISFWVYFAGAPGGSPVFTPYEVPNGVEYFPYLPMLVDWDAVPIATRVQMEMEQAMFQLDVLPGGAGAGLTAAGVSVPIVDPSTIGPLPSAPVNPASLILVTGGIVLNQGTDYTLSGTNITFNPAVAGFLFDPATDYLKAWYV